MKKIFAIVLALVMILSLAACGGEDETKTSFKVGMVCIGDETQAYDKNFYLAADKATERLAAEGIDIEWVKTYNHAEGADVQADNEALAEDGCIVIFNNSYGQENAMLLVAPDYPDVVFASLTNEASQRDSLDNTINAFPSVYEGRYLAGVAAGMKLSEMIKEGKITESEAIIGYVGAFTYAEVISGYTAFYLGAKSECPSVTMYVSFIGKWGDYALEQAAATSLIDDYHCVLISQHSDQVSPAAVAQEKGVYHVGYNISMISEAPDASIISTRIDWTNYFVKVIKAAVNKEKQDQDYKGCGLKTGDVVVTELNEKLAAAGTAEKLAQVREEIENGSRKVFDTSAFTVDGKTVTSFLVDMDGDYAITEADGGVDAVFDGEFHESYFKSAPYFNLQIDGITLINEKF